MPAIAKNICNDLTINASFLFSHKFMATLRYHSYQDFWVIAIIKKIVDDNKKNISAKAQFYIPYGFWEEDFYRYSFHSPAICLPWKQSKRSWQPDCKRIEKKKSIKIIFSETIWNIELRLCRNIPSTNFYKYFFFFFFFFFLLLLLKNSGCYGNLNWKSSFGIKCGS